MSAQASIDGIAIPPVHLIDRIIGINDLSDEGKEWNFFNSGARSLAELEGILQHSDLSLDDHLSVLDWGCGSGRVTLQMMRRYPKLQVTGVDVDGGAISWLNSLGLMGRFDTCELSPPLPYDDASFDLCVNHSVLTHIGESDQRLWLAEIARLVKKDGYFVTSVHGMHALMGQAHHLEAEGISADRWYGDWAQRQFVWVPDDHFTGSTHDAGYHTTFQDPTTIEEFSDFALEPICFIFGGDLGLQDHLLFRRRSTPAATTRARARQVAVATAPTPTTTPNLPAEAEEEAPLPLQELTRVWTMAAANLASVGQQVGRLQNEIWQLSHSLAQQDAPIQSRNPPSLVVRAARKARRDVVAIFRRGERPSRKQRG